MFDPTSHRSGRGSLLASTSLAALLIGGGVPAAFAACNANYTGTTSPGCTNAVTITGIAINNATITSSITNTGTISPNGIVLTNASTITGLIIDGSTDTIYGGISLDSTSKITSTANAISISGPTFTGGISNAGTISAGADGSLPARPAAVSCNRASWPATCSSTWC